MPSIILTVGPPGCGKSIWSRLYIENHKAKRLNRDDFRMSMQNGIYSEKDEKIIKRIRNYAIESWLQAGYDVIIDDTNLTPDVFPKMQEIARRVGDVAVHEHIIKIGREICWYNNMHRDVGVVPADQWNVLWLKYSSFKRHDDYYAPPRQIKLEMFLNEYQNTDLLLAIIVDLDETMALHVHGRDPYDHSRIAEDIPNIPLVDILNTCGEDIILVSGRSEKAKAATEEWLDKHEIPYDLLLMRPSDKPDVKDYVIKKDLYETHVKGKYFVSAVFEDREQDVEMWRDLGLPVYHYNFGRY